MNFLAHALLAGGDADLEVGGVLGDFVRGKPDPELPAGLRAGISLHRAVDTFTDQHAEVVAARRLFAPPWRRYAGIMLDVWFDHCLARDFGRWSDEPLEIFSARLQRRLAARAPCLPVRLRHFAAWMRSRDVPAAYADEAVIEEVLEGLGRRLTRANPLDRCLPILKRHDVELGKHFQVFFPQLTTFARHWRRVHCKASLAASDE